MLRFFETQMSKNLALSKRTLQAEKARKDFAAISAMTIAKYKPAAVYQWGSTKYDTAVCRKSGWLLRDPP
jgi:hypothetical protein